MADVMIDIEALGVKDSSIILTIGAQQFDPGLHGWYEEPQYDFVGKFHYVPYMNVRVDVDQQEKLNRTTDKDTMDWWAKQSPEAITEAFSDEDRVSLHDAVDQLIQVCTPCKRVWAKGTTYDMNILGHAIVQCGKKLPWKFWEVRDARTVYSLVPTMDTNMNGHIALDDCRNQIILLQEAFRTLGVSQIK
jgi:3' exoribonuclease, RNase T-like